MVILWLQKFFGHCIKHTKPNKLKPSSKHFLFCRKEKNDFLAFIEKDHCTSMLHGCYLLHYGEDKKMNNSYIVISYQNIKLWLLQQIELTMKYEFELIKYYLWFWLLKVLILSHIQTLHDGQFQISMSTVRLNHTDINVCNHSNTFFQCIWEDNLVKNVSCFQHKTQNKLNGCF